MKKVSVLLIAILFLFGCSDSNKSTAGDKTGLHWYTNIDEAVKVAQKEDKPILLQFSGSDWCKWCIKLNNEVLHTKEFADYAKDNMDIPMQDEDLGQTFGAYGAGPGFYINLPILGPSSLRDTLGIAGDYFLDPISYVTPTIDRIAIRAGDQINRTSLRLEDYENIKEDAIDPYLAFRDIYHQYRESKIDK